MGLTVKSVGRGAIDGDIQIRRYSESEKIIAFAGNPNVGKSTIFNALTGMNQHTGNWPGKTVASAQGFFRTAQNKYILVDTPVHIPFFRIRRKKKSPEISFASAGRMRPSSFATRPALPAI